MSLIESQASLCESANLRAGAEVMEASFATPSANVTIMRYHMPEPFALEVQPREMGRLYVLLTRHRRRGALGSRSQQDVPLGEVMFVPPNTPFRIQAEPGRHRVLICYLANRDDDGDWRPTDAQLNASVDITERHIRELGRRLAFEALHPGLASQSVIEAISHVLITDLTRFYLSLKEREGPQCGGLSPWRLRLIEERVAQDGPPPSMDELAKLCGLSARQVRRCYSQSRQETLGSYMTRVRMDRGKALLATDRPITAVAEQLGYSCASSFAAAFRAAVGVSPREYRAHCRAMVSCH